MDHPQSPYPPLSTEERPYRSHLKPACFACRKRKCRCTTRNESRRCISCEVHGTACDFPSTKSRSAQPVSTVLPTTSAHMRHFEPSANTAIERQSFLKGASDQFSLSDAQVVEENGQTVDENALDGTVSIPNLEGLTQENDVNSSYVVGPALARDKAELQHYFSDPACARFKRVINTNSSNDPSKLVLFTTVLRRPVGSTVNQSLASSKCEIIEKLIGPNIPCLIDIFFSCANNCLPIFEESLFRETLRQHKAKLSPAMLANLYANSLVYWPTSHKLKHLSRPDQQFTWVQANEALHSELFLAPGISTILAVLLNIGGRPCTSIFGNGSLLGMAIALSNAIGLNRDSSSWNISPSEKAFRMRIWWLIVIHDRWFSLAYGTPLQIHRWQTDVPVPNVDDLCHTQKSSQYREDMAIFVALISLTEVLGRYLEHIYCLHRDTSLVFKCVMQCEAVLDDWENTLEDMVHRIAVRGVKSDRAGAANLRVGYLAVRMLLRRIQLELSRRNSNADQSELYFEMQIQEVAGDMLRFLHNLDEDQCRGFWLPAHAYSLTSTATFLLRTALKKREQTPNTALQLAKDLVAILQNHHDQNSWDIESDCLTNSVALLQRVEAATTTTSPVPSDIANLTWFGEGEIIDPNDHLLIDDPFFQDAFF